MRNPQIINLQTGQDTRIAIDGANVIDDTSQIVLTDAPWGDSPITVDIALMDLTSASTTIFDSLIMTYDSDTDFWFINLDQGTPNLKDTLVDRKKYVGKINEHTGSVANMRDIKVQEFTVDNDVSEYTLSRLPFRIEIGTPSYIVWYASEWATAMYRAKLYMGEGVSVVNADDASRVTSRGALEIL